MAIKLQLFSAKDHQRLITWMADADTLTLWSGSLFTHPLDEKQLAQHHRDDGHNLPPFRRIYKAVDNASGEVVGHVEISDIWPSLSGRISGVLVGEKSRRGQGAGEEIVTKAVELAARQFHVDRVDLAVLRQNAPAIRCYRKCGFVRVGSWPNAVNLPDGHADIEWMTLFDVQSKVSNFRSTAPSLRREPTLHL
ncbi:hypothetical protein EOS_35670 [Caballeronia mineralivorans PML1(12)]|uniref:N-acetyltransferase domain-containing protein n=1 Tax=Caballeronia mineralivorans PML1(12) TaxID=908627 RepID=A0A0J1CLW8_9BURK|nr:GNAT family protein [Caballeronia mineralivorans]KLU21509.1 hypothetical protein EOS_35670 [Caballeronia mineralivorans PML1(12)]